MYSSLHGDALPYITSNLSIRVTILYGNEYYLDSLLLVRNQEGMIT